MHRAHNQQQQLQHQQQDQQQLAPRPLTLTLLPSAANVKASSRMSSKRVPMRYTSCSPLTPPKPSPTQAQAETRIAFFRGNVRAVTRSDMRW